jgi:DNA-binding response OmpR family regulator
MLNQTIVVINDDKLYLELMHNFLSEEGYTHVLCKPISAAYETILRESPALLLLNIDLTWLMPIGRLLTQLCCDTATATIPVIICSTDAQLPRKRADWFQNTRCDFLEMPFDLDDLLAKVQAIVGPPYKQNSSQL